MTPTPPRREGTVGPEQLRDFSLPGTRQEPATSAPTTAPAPVRQPSTAAPRTPAPRTTVQAQVREEARPARQAKSELAPTTTEQAPQASAPVAEPVTQAPTPALLPPVTTLPLPSAPPAATLPASSSGTGPGWWPWLLLAAVLGIGGALLLRRRQSSEADKPLAFAGPQPAPAFEPQPPASKPAMGPPLPSGLVTTRRFAQPEPVSSAPPLPAGGVVSTRLRPWVDLDLAVSDIAVSDQEVVINFKLTLGNGGSNAARDIAIEALGLNAGETQDAELATFFARPRAAATGIDLLPAMDGTEIAHAVRMPRGAVLEYAAEGRRLFVPLLAFNIHYRWSQGQGQTSAAFLLGHEQPGSDRLAPLRLDRSAARLGKIGARRLQVDQRS